MRLLFTLTVIALFLAILGGLQHDSDAFTTAALGSGVGTAAGAVVAVLLFAATQRAERRKAERERAEEIELSVNAGVAEAKLILAYVTEVLDHAWEGDPEAPNPSRTTERWDREGGPGVQFYKLTTDRTALDQLQIAHDLASYVYTVAQAYRGMDSDEHKQDLLHAADYSNEATERAIRTLKDAITN